MHIFFAATIDVWRTPHVTIAFFALMMAILSLWVKRSPWIWGSFLIIAFVMAFYAKLVTSIALAPIGGLFILHAVLKGDLRGFLRFICVVAVVAISIGLWFHYFPGFRRWILLQQAIMSPGGYPYDLFLSFDKPFIGFFLLAWGFPLLKNPDEFNRLLRIALPLTIAGIFIMAILALSSGLIKWDPKFPNMIWLFAPINLLLVVIPEEAFLRGFVQGEFFRSFGGRGFLANTGCILITALLFAALHWIWVPSIPFLTLVFVAGIIYGSIYQYTRCIEASIFCHWLFNMTHLLLFT